MCGIRIRLRYLVALAVLASLVLTAMVCTDRSFAVGHDPRETWLLTWMLRLYVDSITSLSVLSLGIVARVRLSPSETMERRRWSRPGVIAAVLITIVVLLFAIRVGLEWLLAPRWSPWAPHIYMVCLWIGNGGAMAVCAGWVLLTMMRRWQKYRGDWTDRLGRWLGYSWLACSLGWWSVWVLSG